GLVAFAIAVIAVVAIWQARGPAVSAGQHAAFIDDYCADCHNAVDLEADLDLAERSLDDLAADRDIWEAVVRKLRVGMMPPSDAAQPPADQRRAVVASLEQRLDRVAAAAPDPGPTLVRRLNRTEYANAIRDLLDLRIDPADFLPPDDAAYGFDNNAEALTTSPFLIEQYLSAAGKIAALAVGDPATGPVGQTFRFRQDASQDVPIDGMPLGTVGGGRVDVVLPLDGEYQLDVRFYKSNLGAMKGLELPTQLEIAVDGERVHLASIGGDADFRALMQNITQGADAVEARSSTRVPLKAGPHEITVGFVYQGALQTSRRLQPFLRSSQDLLDVTGHPHIEFFTVTGPFDPTGAGDTPSRRRIFSCGPYAGDRWQADTRAADERACAEEILSRLARSAYRGNATERDVDVLLDFFDDGRAQSGSFEQGVQTALERLLASPKFTFRLEADPAGLESGDTHAVTGLELATRLSFFLWSSIPDETLLGLAESGELSNAAVLEQQVGRMLADDKAAALVDNFAAQWLYLRNLRSIVPNSATFPDFDDNLRQGLLRETELFVDSIIREDRSVVDLLTASDTFLNERVAR
ncbi:MAG: DUF1592 domain-containing protein, partial [Gammaproteobacteria bacterium]|nr:DUF1592 domain-containing protein [Gammaproteobacteria bacterium]